MLKTAVLTLLWYNEGVKLALLRRDEHEGLVQEEGVLVFSSAG